MIALYALLVINIAAGCRAEQKWRMVLGSYPNMNDCSNNLEGNASCRCIQNYGFISSGTFRCIGIGLFYQALFVSRKSCGIRGVGQNVGNLYRQRFGATTTHERACVGRFSSGVDVNGHGADASGINL